MRRLASLAVLALFVAGVLAAMGAGGTAGGRYRVDAIFDNVAFLTPGQDVRVAGAAVGQVTGMQVTADHQARVQMEVDADFAPFRADADCVIQPQSLIGEKFVQCTPGTPQGAELVATDGHPPTVPVTNTHSPVDTDLVLGTFDRPTRERLGILLGSLGAGLAGRGEDLRAAILRANPALAATRRVLATLEADRDDLRSLLRDGETVLTALARRRERVRVFVRSAAAVADTTAERRQRLRNLVRDLPGFLDEARPTLTRLTAFANEAAPLARDLRVGAPAATALVTQAGDFSGRAAPTLRALGPTVRRATQAVPDIAPELRRLRRFGAANEPAAKLLADLGLSFRANGGLGGVGSFLYYVTSALARFDGISHILPAYLLGTPCALHSTTPVAGCDAHYESSATRVRRAQQTERRLRPKRTASRPKPSAESPTVKPKVPAPPSGAAVSPKLPDTPLPDEIESIVQDALDALGTLGDGLRGGREGTSDSAPSDQATEDLLEFLLG